MRAVVSAPLAGGYGTITWMGRVAVAVRTKGAVARPARSVRRETRVGIALSFRHTSNRAANEFVLFFRQTIEEGFLQMPSQDEIRAAEWKLRVAITEALVDLSAFPAKVILDIPHVRRRRCSGGPSLEFRHDLAERRLQCGIVGFARDFLFGWRPLQVTIHLDFSTP